MPEGAVYVGRPTRWGNPYRVGDPDPMFVGNAMTAEDTVRMFEWYVEAHPRYAEAVQAELRGKDLACWCSLDQPCHADVLLEIANERGQR
jgi:hypothetical protein